MSLDIFCAWNVSEINCFGRIGVKKQKEKWVFVRKKADYTDKGNKGMDGGRER